jgi:8-oxo-dGTP diphosphatase
MERRALVCGQLVGEQIRVSRHDRVTHFDGPPLGVVSRTDQPEHGDPGGEAEKPGLLGGRHPSADLFGEARQRVTTFLKPRVDPARAGIGLTDRCALRQVSGNVGHSRLDRPAVKGVPPRPYDDAVSVSQAQTFGHLGGRPCFADLDHVDGRVRLALLGLGQECGLAFLAVALREAIGRETPHGRPGADVHTAAVLGCDQALVEEHPQGVADGHPGDAIVTHERNFRWELRTLAEPAPADRRAQVVRDLPVHSTVAAWVDVLGEHIATAHADFAPQLVQTSTTVSVPGEDQKIRTSPALHSVSVAGVVVDDQNRALLIRRRDNQHWEPPGGVLEVDEAIEDGLRREVREETGLTVEPVALTGVYKNMSRGIVALVFRCRALTTDLSANSEVSDFRWATPAEVRSMAAEAFAIRILDALTHDDHPAVRQHDGVHLT